MTIPNVTVTSPLNGAFNVAINSSIQIRFNTPMMLSSLNSSDILVVKVIDPLTGRTTPVLGVITYDASNNIASFTATQNFAFDTIYQAIIVGDPQQRDTIPVGVRSITGETMPATYLFRFTTEVESTVKEDEEEEDEVIIPSGNLAVINTIPMRGTIQNSGKNVYIFFNDDLVINNTGITEYLIPYSGENAYINNHVSVYRTQAMGMDSSYSFSPLTPISYIYNNTNELLTLTLQESGTILPYNMQYIVTINPGMSGEITHEMLNTYQFDFTTILTPVYVSPQYVRLNLGTIGNQFDDAYIYRIIHRYSAEIYNKYIEAGTSLPYYPLGSGKVPGEVFNWVLCNTKRDLINQILMDIGGTSGGSITLGDFSMNRGDSTAYYRNELKNLDNCIQSSNILIIRYLHPSLLPVVPHLNDSRAPWYDRDGKYRHTLKGDDNVF